MRVGTSLEGLTRARPITEDQLFEAALIGNLHSFKIPNIYAYKALQLAAHNKHINDVKHVLRGFKLWYFTALDIVRPFEGWCFYGDAVTSSPLHLAVKEGHLDVVLVIMYFFKFNRVLDSAVNSEDHSKRKAAEEWYQGLVEWAIRWGHAAIVKVIVFWPLHPLVVFPLHLAAYSRHHLGVMELLLRHKEKLPKFPLFSQDGLTPLHLAAQAGSSSAVQILADTLGMSLTERSCPELFTPLHMAAHSGQTGVVHVLLENLQQLEVVAKDCMGRTALHYAALKGHRDVVEQLLNFAWRCADMGSIALEADYDGLLPLHMAARNGHAEVIACLLPHGGITSKAKHSLKMRNLLLREFKGKGLFKSTCVYFGERWRFPRPQLIHSLFLKTEGFTPLHFAARYGHKAAVKELLSAVFEYTSEASSEDSLFMKKDSRGFLAYDWMKVRKQGRIFLKYIMKVHCGGGCEQISSHIKRASCCMKMTGAEISRIAAEICEEEVALEEMQHAWERAKSPRPTITMPIVRLLEGKDLGCPGVNWLHWAVRKGDMDMLQSLLKLDAIDVNEKDGTGFSALQNALQMPQWNDDILKALLWHPGIKFDASSCLESTLGCNNLVCAREIVLSSAPASLSEQVSKLVMEKVLTHQWTCLQPKEYVNVNRFLVALVKRENLLCASDMLTCLLPWAKQRNMRDVVDLILDRPELKPGLYEDRQLYLDCANAILVGATLIAGVAFEGWLQPPLGYSFRYGAESFADVHKGAVRCFWWFNNGAFFFAVATLIAGAKGAVPVVEETDIVKSVTKVRRAVAVASILLGMAMVCMVGAFTAAGYSVLPPLSHDRDIMRISVAWGAFACGLTLFWFYASVWPLIRCTLAEPVVSCVCYALAHVWKMFQHALGKFSLFLYRLCTVNLAGLDYN